MPTIVYKCKCGAISSFGTREVGELRRCDKCLSSFMVPFESSPGTNLAPDALLEVPGEPVLRHERAPITENVPVDFGKSFPLAYAPSGAPGDVGRLMLAGFPAIGAGLAAGTACVGAAFGLNVVHNLLPVFIFVFPIVILALLAVSPGVLGWVTGLVVSKSVQEAKCRYPAVAGVVALLWTIGAIAFILVAAQFSMSDGESFLDDGLVPFVREMTAYCLTFEYLEDPDPVNVPAWVIFLVLGGSALLGVFVAYGAAEEKVRSAPYCEHCDRYMTKHTLWRISPVHALKAVAAFLSLDYKAIRQIPYCDFSKNRIDVEAWGCLCRHEYILELTGHATVPASDGDGIPETREPVRLFSRKLSLDELNKVRENGVRDMSQIGK